MRRIHLEYRRPGQSSTTYIESLVLDRPDIKVLLLEEYEGEDVHVGNACILDAGAPIVWFVFPEKWHDIGRFHRSDGTFTGWYTNLCQPMEINDDRWIGRDLFLDLWQPIDGPPVWLDEQELSDAMQAGIIDAQTQRRISNERTIIDFQVRQGAWPPAVARDIDLVQAREMMK